MDVSVTFLLKFALNYETKTCAPQSGLRSTDAEWLGTLRCGASITTETQKSTDETPMPKLYVGYMCECPHSYAVTVSAQLCRHNKISIYSRLQETLQSRTVSGTRCRFTHLDVEFCSNLFWCLAFYDVSHCLACQIQEALDVQIVGSLHASPL